MKYNKLLDLFCFLKDSFDFPYPIMLRRTKMPQGVDGDCRILNDFFLVRIEKSYTEKNAIEILLHELSHCLAWNENDMHGDGWGKAYSQVYRKFLEWNQN